MAALIRTFCETCATLYARDFRLKPIPGATTTEKKKYCEACKRSFGSPFDLKQYLVSGKGGKP